MEPLDEDTPSEAAKDDSIQPKITKWKSTSNLWKHLETAEVTAASLIGVKTEVTLVWKVLGFHYSKRNTLIAVWNPKLMMTIAYV